MSPENRWWHIKNFKTDMYSLKKDVDKGKSF